MPQKLNYFRETASQTAGPYVHIGLAPGAAGFELFEKELGQDIVGPNAKGERITITGRVLDGTGSPVRDVLLETWQANSAGSMPMTKIHDITRWNRGFQAGDVLSPISTAVNS